MTRTEFDNLVEQLERDYAHRDRALAWRTALVAALGYAGFLGWVLLIAAAGVACFVGAAFAPNIGGVALVIVGAVILAAALWQAIEVLWLPPIDSKPFTLRPADAPELFALLTRLRHEFRMPKIHRVDLNLDFNASITHRARLGLLGFSRNIMTLGLPLLDVLTPQEFESVAAHECAHLSPRHGRFAAWTYRVRGTWLSLINRSQEPPKSPFSRAIRRLLGKFFNWYWQRFHAYFFVMSRRHEYEADRCAADWAGADQAAAHLTDNSDTHPCLADRLASIGSSIAHVQSLGIPQPPAPSAAHHLFGAHLDEIRSKAENAWRTEVLPVWTARHGRARSIQRRLRDAEPKGTNPSAVAAALWDRAAAALELEGHAAAEPLLREVLAARPAHASANLALGRILLEREDPEGETLLRRILCEPDNSLLQDACHLLAHHFRTTGQADQMRAIYQELSHHQLAQDKGASERTEVSARDAFVAADLTPDDLAALEQTLAADPDFAVAHLAKKLHRHASGQPVFVLVVRARRQRFSQRQRDHELAQRLIPKLRLPGQVLVITPHASKKRLARKITNTPGSPIQV